MAWILLVIAGIIIIALFNRVNRLEADLKIYKRRVQSSTAHELVTYVPASTKRKSSPNTIGIRESLGLGDNEEITYEHLSVMKEKKIDSSVLYPDLENAPKDSFFYNKKVVFTGDLETLTRAEAADAIFKLGADINTAISKKTQIVIFGKNPGPSKMNKITAINSSGGNIQLLSEKDFLSYL